MAPVLDVSGSWTDGDQYRVLQCLALPASEYMVSGVIGCMNSISDSLAARVVAELDAYDAAYAAQTAADTTNTNGTVLVKADVLSYQYIGGATGTARAMAAASDRVRLMFASCPYVPQTPYGGATPLIHS